MTEPPIFIARNGQRLGAFTPDEARRKLAAGEVSIDDLAWHEGLPTWQPLGSVVKITGGNTIPQTSQTALAGMIVGIFGLLLLPVCGILTIIAATVAVVCGHIATEQIKKSDGVLTGKGMALASLILGYAALILYVLLFICILVFFVFRTIQGN